MAKIIKITPECVDEIRKEFESVIQNMKIADGKISYTKNFGSINRKATVFFEEDAWQKMNALIQSFDKEVAWHGVATRGNDPSKDEYFIHDILVYPQEVTGATVNTDQKEYEMWLMQLDDDVFNNVRMQGHSHVNMATSPSGVDTTHQEKILAQLEDDMFYIFMIWNKRGEKNIKIYDLAKNTLFETADVTVMILDNGDGIESFLKSAKEMVKNKTYTAPTPPANASNNNNYSGYKGYGSGFGYQGGQIVNTSASTWNNNAPSGAAKDSKTPATNSKNGSKKGKRKGKSSTKNSFNHFQQTSLLGNGGKVFPYDEDDDIYR